MLQTLQESERNYLAVSLIHFFSDNFVTNVSLNTAILSCHVSRRADIKIQMWQ